MKASQKRNKRKQKTYPKKEKKHVKEFFKNIFCCSYSPSQCKFETSESENVYSPSLKENVEKETAKGFFHANNKESCHLVDARNSLEIVKVQRKLLLVIIRLFKKTPSLKYSLSQIKKVIIVLVILKRNRRFVCVNIVYCGSKIVKCVRFISLVKYENFTHKDFFRRKKKCFGDQFEYLVYPIEIKFPYLYVENNHSKIFMEEMAITKCFYINDTQSIVDNTNRQARFYENQRKFMKEFYLAKQNSVKRIVNEKLKKRLFSKRFSEPKGCASLDRITHIPSDQSKLKMSIEKTNNQFQEMYRQPIKQNCSENINHLEYLAQKNNKQPLEYKLFSEIVSYLDDTSKVRFAIEYGVFSNIFSERKITNLQKIKNTEIINSKDATVNLLNTKPQTTVQAVTKICDYHAGYHPKVRKSQKFMSIQKFSSSNCNLECSSSIIFSKGGSNSTYTSRQNYSAQYKKTCCGMGTLLGSETCRVFVDFKNHIKELINYQVNEVTFNPFFVSNFDQLGSKRIFEDDQKSCKIITEVDKETLLPNASLNSLLSKDSSIPKHIRPNGEERLICPNIEFFQENTSFSKNLQTTVNTCKIANPSIKSERIDPKYTVDINLKRVPRICETLAIIQSNNQNVLNIINYDSGSALSEELQDPLNTFIYDQAEDVIQDDKISKQEIPRYILHSRLRPSYSTSSELKVFYDVNTDRKLKQQHRPVYSDEDPLPILKEINLLEMALNEEHLQVSKNKSSEELPIEPTISTSSDEALPDVITYKDKLQLFKERRHVQYEILLCPQQETGINQTSLDPMQDKKSGLVPECATEEIITDIVPAEESKVVKRANSLSPTRQRSKLDVEPTAASAPIVWKTSSSTKQIDTLLESLLTKEKTRISDKDILEILKESSNISLIKDTKAKPKEKGGKITIYKPSKACKKRCKKECQCAEKKTRAACHPKKDVSNTKRRKEIKEISQPEINLIEDGKLSEQDLAADEVLQRSSDLSLQKDIKLSYYDSREIIRKDTLQPSLKQESKGQIIKSPERYSKISLISDLPSNIKTHVRSSDVSLEILLPGDTKLSDYIQSRDNKEITKNESSFTKDSTLKKQSRVSFADELPSSKGIIKRASDVSLEILLPDQLLNDINIIKTMGEVDSNDMKQRIIEIKDLSTNTSENLEQKKFDMRDHGGSLVHLQNINEEMHSDDERADMKHKAKTLSLKTYESHICGDRGRIITAREKDRIDAMFRPKIETKRPSTQQKLDKSTIWPKDMQVDEGSQTGGMKLEKGVGNAEPIAENQAYIEKINSFLEVLMGSKGSLKENHEYPRDLKISIETASGNKIAPVDDDQSESSIGVEKQPLELIEIDQDEIMSENSESMESSAIKLSHTKKAGEMFIFKDFSPAEVHPKIKEIDSLLEILEDNDQSTKDDEFSEYLDFLGEPSKEMVTIRENEESQDLDVSVESKESKVDREPTGLDLLYAGEEGSFTSKVDSLLEILMNENKDELKKVEILNDKVDFKQPHDHIPDDAVKISETEEFKIEEEPAQKGTSSASIIIEDREEDETKNDEMMAIAEDKEPKEDDTRERSEPFYLYEKIDPNTIPYLQKALEELYEKESNEPNTEASGTRLEVEGQEQIRTPSSDEYHKADMTTIDSNLESKSQEETRKESSDKGRKCTAETINRDRKSKSQEEEGREQSLDKLIKASMEINEELKNKSQEEERGRSSPKDHKAFDEHFEGERQNEERKMSVVPDETFKNQEEERRRSSYKDHKTFNEHFESERQKEPIKPFSVSDENFKNQEQERRRSSYKDHKTFEERKPSAVSEENFKNQEQERRRSSYKDRKRFDEHFESERQKEERKPSAVSDENLKNIRQEEEKPHRISTETTKPNLESKYEDVTHAEVPVTTLETKKPNRDVNTEAATATNIKDQQADSKRHSTAFERRRSKRQTEPCLGENYELKSEAISGFGAKKPTRRTRVLSDETYELNTEATVTAFDRKKPSSGETYEYPGGKSSQRGFLSDETYKNLPPIKENELYTEEVKKESSTTEQLHDQHEQQLENSESKTPYISEDTGVRKTSIKAKSRKDRSRRKSKGEEEELEDTTNTKELMNDKGRRHRGARRLTKDVETVDLESKTNRKSAQLEDIEPSHSNGNRAGKSLEEKGTLTDAKAPTGSKFTRVHYNQATVPNLRSSLRNDKDTKIYTLENTKSNKFVTVVDEAMMPKMKLSKHAGTSTISSLGNHQASSQYLRSNHYHSGGNIKYCRNVKVGTNEKLDNRSGNSFWKAFRKDEKKPKKYSFKSLNEQLKLKFHKRDPKLNQNLTKDKSTSAWPYKASSSPELQYATLRSLDSLLDTLFKADDQSDKKKGSTKFHQIFSNHNKFPNMRKKNLSQMSMRSVRVGTESNTRQKGSNTSRSLKSVKIVTDNSKPSKVSRDKKEKGTSVKCVRSVAIGTKDGFKMSDEKTKCTSGTSPIQKGQLGKPKVKLMVKEDGKPKSIAEALADIKLLYVLCEERSVIVRKNAKPVSFTDTDTERLFFNEPSSKLEDQVACSFSNDSLQSNKTLSLESRQQTEEQEYQANKFNCLTSSENTEMTQESPIKSDISLPSLTFPRKLSKYQPTEYSISNRTISKMSLDPTFWKHNTKSLRDLSTDQHLINEDNLYSSKVSEKMVGYLNVLPENSTKSSIKATSTNKELNKQNKSIDKQNPTVPPNGSTVTLTLKASSFIEDSKQNCKQSSKNCILDKTVTPSAEEMLIKKDSYDTKEEKPQEVDLEDKPPTECLLYVNKDKENTSETNATFKESSSSFQSIDSNDNDLTKSATKTESSKKQVTISKEKSIKIPAKVPEVTKPSTCNTTCNYQKKTCTCKTLQEHKKMCLCRLARAKQQQQQVQYPFKDSYLFNNRNASSSKTLETKVKQKDSLSSYAASTSSKYSSHSKSFKPSKRKKSKKNKRVVKDYSETDSETPSSDSWSSYEDSDKEDSRRKQKHRPYVDSTDSEEDPKSSQLTSSAINLLLELVEKNRKEKTADTQYVDSSKLKENKTSPEEISSLLEFLIDKKKELSQSRRIVSTVPNANVYPVFDRTKEDFEDFCKNNNKQEKHHQKSKRKHKSKRPRNYYKAFDMKIMDMQKTGERKFGLSRLFPSKEKAFMKNVSYVEKSIDCSKSSCSRGSCSLDDPNRKVSFNKEDNIPAKQIVQVSSTINKPYPLQDYATSGLQADSAKPNLIADTERKVSQNNYLDRDGRTSSFIIIPKSELRDQIQNNKIKSFSYESAPSLRSRDSLNSRKDICLLNRMSQSSRDTSYSVSPRISPLQLESATQTRLPTSFSKSSRETIGSTSLRTPKGILSTEAVKQRRAKFKDGFAQTSRHRNMPANTLISGTPSASDDSSMYLFSNASDLTFDRVFRRGYAFPDSNRQTQATSVPYSSLTGIPISTQSRESDATSNTSRVKVTFPDVEKGTQASQPLTTHSDFSAQTVPAGSQKDTQTLISEQKKKKKKDHCKTRSETKYPDSDQSVQTSGLKKLFTPKSLDPEKSRPSKLFLPKSAQSNKEKQTSSSKWKFRSTKSSQSEVENKHLAQDPENLAKRNKSKSLSKYTSPVIELKDSAKVYKRGSEKEQLVDQSAVEMTKQPSKYRKDDLDANIPAGYKSAQEKRPLADQSAVITARQPPRYQKRNLDANIQADYKSIPEKRPPVVMARQPPRYQTDDLAANIHADYRSLPEKRPFADQPGVVMTGPPPRYQREDLVANIPPGYKSVPEKRIFADQSTAMMAKPPPRYQKGDLYTNIPPGYKSVPERRPLSDQSPVVMVRQPARYQREDLEPNIPVGYKSIPDQSPVVMVRQPPRYQKGDLEANVRVDYRSVPEKRPLSEQSAIVMAKQPPRYQKSDLEANIPADYRSVPEKRTFADQSPVVMVRQPPRYQKGDLGANVPAGYKSVPQKRPLSDQSPVVIARQPPRYPERGFDMNIRADYKLDSEKRPLPEQSLAGIVKQPSKYQKEDFDANIPIAYRTESGVVTAKQLPKYPKEDLGASIPTVHKSDAEKKPLPGQSAVTIVEQAPKYQKEDFDANVPTAYKAESGEIVVKQSPEYQRGDLDTYIPTVYPPDSEKNLLASQKEDFDANIPTAYKTESGQMIIQQSPEYQTGDLDAYAPSVYPTESERRLITDQSDVVIAKQFLEYQQQDFDADTPTAYQTESGTIIVQQYPNYQEDDLYAPTVYESDKEELADESAVMIFEQPPQYQQDDLYTDTSVLINADDTSYGYQSIQEIEGYAPEETSVENLPPTIISNDFSELKEDTVQVKPPKKVGRSGKETTCSITSCISDLVKARKSGSKKSKAGDSAATVDILKDSLFEEHKSEVFELEPKPKEEEKPTTSSGRSKRRGGRVPRRGIIEATYLTAIVPNQKEKTKGDKQSFLVYEIDVGRKNKKLLLLPDFSVRRSNCAQSNASSHELKIEKQPENNDLFKLVTQGEKNILDIPSIKGQENKALIFDKNQIVKEDPKLLISTIGIQASLQGNNSSCTEDSDDSSGYYKIFKKTPYKKFLNKTPVTTCNKIQNDKASVSTLEKQKGNHRISIMPDSDKNTQIWFYDQASLADESDVDSHLDMESLKKKIPKTTREEVEDILKTKNKVSTNTSVIVPINKEQQEHTFLFSGFTNKENKKPSKTALYEKSSSSSTLSCMINPKSDWLDQEKCLYGKPRHAKANQKISSKDDNKNEKTSKEISESSGVKNRRNDSKLLTLKNLNKNAQILSVASLNDPELNLLESSRTLRAIQERQSITSKTSTSSSTDSEFKHRKFHPDQDHTNSQMDNKEKPYVRELESSTQTCPHKRSFMSKGPNRKTFHNVLYLTVEEPESLSDNSQDIPKELDSRYFNKSKDISAPQRNKESINYNSAKSMDANICQYCETSKNKPIREDKNPLKFYTNSTNRHEETKTVDDASKCSQEDFRCRLYEPNRKQKSSNFFNMTKPLTILPIGIDTNFYDVSTKPSLNEFMDFCELKRKNNKKSKIGAFLHEELIREESETDFKEAEVSISLRKKIVSKHRGLEKRKHAGCEIFQNKKRKEKKSHRYKNLQDGTNPALLKRNSFTLLKQNKTRKHQQLQVDSCNCMSLLPKDRLLMQVLKVMSRQFEKCEHVRSEPFSQAFNYRSSLLLQALNSSSKTLHSSNKSEVILGTSKALLKLAASSISSLMGISSISDSFTVGDFQDHIRQQYPLLLFSHLRSPNPEFLLPINNNSSGSNSVNLKLSKNTQNTSDSIEEIEEDDQLDIAAKNQLFSCFVLVPDRHNNIDLFKHKKLKNTSFSSNLGKGDTMVRQDVARVYNTETQTYIKDIEGRKMKKRHHEKHLSAVLDKLSKIHLSDYTTIFEIAFENISIQTIYTQECECQTIFCARYKRIRNLIVEDKWINTTNESSPISETNLDKIGKHNVKSNLSRIDDMKAAEYPILILPKHAQDRLDLKPRLKKLINIENLRADKILLLQTESVSEGRKIDSNTTNSNSTFSWEERSVPKNRVNSHAYQNKEQHPTIYPNTKDSASLNSTSKSSSSEQSSSTADSSSKHTVLPSALYKNTTKDPSSKREFHDLKNLKCYFTNTSKTHDSHIKEETRIDPGLQTSSNKNKKYDKPQNSKSKSSFANTTDIIFLKNAKKLSKYWNPETISDTSTSTSSVSTTNTEILNMCHHKIFCHNMIQSKPLEEKPTIQEQPKKPEIWQIFCNKRYSNQNTSNMQCQHAHPVNHNVMAFSHEYAIPEKENHTSNNAEMTKYWKHGKDLDNYFRNLGKYEQMKRLQKYKAPHKSSDVNTKQLQLPYKKH